MASRSSLRDGDRWEQVGVKVATSGATGAVVGLGLAVLLFGKTKTRSACLSVCTGAGVGHGLTLGKSTFEDARSHLPAQLSQGERERERTERSHPFALALPLIRRACPVSLCAATTTEEVWDRGVVNGIKKTGIGLLSGGLLMLMVPSAVRMACLTGGAGVGLG